MDNTLLLHYLFAIGSFIAQRKDTYYLLRNRLSKKDVPVHLNLDIAFIKTFLEGNDTDIARLVEEDLELHKMCDLLVVSFEKADDDVRNNIDLMAIMSQIGTVNEKLAY